MKAADIFIEQVRQLSRSIRDADAILVGAGAGLSVSAGFTYSGARFRKYFSDFIETYHFQDMYSAGFYPFETLEEYWAYWSRYIYINRYGQNAGRPYTNLLKLLTGKDYFVLTTNVDHCFQKAGFDKNRLFYTQGDYGLWQCSRPCCQKTYENEQAVTDMVSLQSHMRIPKDLVPRCPVCGAPMSMNLRADQTFVEDEGWHRAANRYKDFLHTHAGSRILFLELGVGHNTPGIIRFPFQEFVRKNGSAHLARVNFMDAHIPEDINGRSIGICEDAGKVIEAVLQDLFPNLLN